eukprot:8292596-Prorocentrum_lima.AAC.1
MDTFPEGRIVLSANKPRDLLSDITNIQPNLKTNGTSHVDLTGPHGHWSSRAQIHFDYGTPVEEGWG